MTDSNDSHSSSGTSSKKPQNDQEFINPQNELALINQGLQLGNMLMGGNEPIPYIPRSGQWWLNHWASFWGESAESLKRKMKKMNYQPIEFGRTIMIDAAKFWHCLETNTEAITEED